jgi:phage baseplate assembly protein W
MSFSDFNPIRPRTVAGVQTYSDLDLRDPFISPYSKDVVPVTDIMAVKNSVRNLVLTNFYETPFDPFKGSNARGLLFENANTYTAIAINKEITRVLIQYEPRVNVTSVDVIDQSDINAYRVTINFNVITLNTQAALNFYLERLR